MVPVSVSLGIDKRGRWTDSPYGFPSSANPKQASVEKNVERTFVVPSTSRRWSSVHFFKTTSENRSLLSLTSFSWKTPLGGKVIGGTLNVLERQQHLLTSTLTWLVSCLPIQSLEKLSNSRSQCSVKVLSSANFFEVLRITFLTSIFYCKKSSPFEFSFWKSESNS